jgi:hypothetical protein
MQMFGLIDDKAFAVRMIPLLKPLFMKAGELIWKMDSSPDGSC